MLYQDEDYRCENCGEKYTDIESEQCKPCQINNYKKDFANWTSGNEKIDEFIQETQLKIKKCNDKIIEWIPYNQFENINEIIKSDFATIYSAIWTNGSLYYYNEYYPTWVRIPNDRVALKCLYHSQNNTNGFLNEV